MIRRETGKNNTDSTTCANEQTNMETARASGELRHALGAFPTGVTIVTAAAGSGELIGITANSFTSVSLDPPLVLWSLAKSALCFAGFAAAQHWAVHVLASEQQGLASRFATSGADKFADVTVEHGMGGAPLISGCSARFECRTFAVYDGGDHVILVGKVMRFERSDSSALLFYRGGFGAFADRDSIENRDGVASAGVAQAGASLHVARI